MTTETDTDTHPLKHCRTDVTRDRIMTQQQAAPTQHGGPTMKRKTIALALAGGLLLAGCSDADVASRNLSREADNFEVQRRIVFYNGINGEYILEVQGLCSLGNEDDAGQLTVTCKTGPEEYKKHFLGLSDNVTYFAEQLEGVNVSEYYYKVNFKPQAIIPDVDVQGTTELPENQ